MSTKERRALDAWWNLLYECAREYQRDVTAGEVGKWAGVSRNTAKKYLDKLVSMKAAYPYRHIGKNGFYTTTYAIMTEAE